MQLNDLLRRTRTFLSLEGRASDLVREEQKAYHIAAILAVASAGATLVAIAASWARGGWFTDISRISIIVNTFFLEVYVAGWLLLRYRRIAGGKLLLMAGALIHITGLVAAFGLNAGAHYYYFALAVAPLIIFASQNRYTRLTFIAAPLLLFVAATVYYQILKRPQLVPRPGEEMYVAGFLILNTVLSVLILLACVYYFYKAGHAAEARLDEERARSEELLLNILPGPIAERLKDGERVIADRFNEATVLFADLVGFTPLSALMTPESLLRLLNRVFTDFDRLADVHELEKIKTIGDAYMAVGGVPNPHSDHAVRIARMALGMMESIRRVSTETGLLLNLRIGIHSGPLVAGVIGSKKFIYDLWGDTVNTASRMEAFGVPGAIQVSGATQALVAGEFRTQSRGMVEIKGKGSMEVFLLLAE